MFKDSNEENSKKTDINYLTSKSYYHYLKFKQICKPLFYKALNFAHSLKKRVEHAKLLLFLTSHKENAYEIV